MIIVVSDAFALAFNHVFKGKLWGVNHHFRCVFVELKKLVREQIGPIATPDVIQNSPGLPKTRSGKLMRRILRKIATNETDSLGDTSTLADPSVVDELIANRQVVGASTD